MQWDLVGSSLGDSLKGSGSSLGTRREIAGKKTRGLTARMSEATGLYGKNPAGKSLLINRLGRWVNRLYDWILALVLKPIDRTLAGLSLNLPKK
ncbi:hypothetical protein BHM03_00059293 [Ensete ventricosum]|nr:hypothetical protein BHM03_00059293 [Ensete ventricosum]